MSEKILTSLNSIDKKLTKLLSKRQVFIRGVIRGVGFAIGAGVVAAIVLSILAWVLNAIGHVPFLDKIIESMNIKDSL
ncbi:hypothetical protein DYH10_00755 [Candidatus Saccharibacteria bacterium CPR2]|nr:hypothetical protein [Candidatus Saccharibacteria bacterium CPR2]